VAWQNCRTILLHTFIPTEQMPNKKKEKRKNPNREPPVQNCIGTVAFLSFVCAGEIVTTHLYCVTAVDFLYCCVNQSGASDGRVLCHLQ
jgi:hypothetical protein